MTEREHAKTRNGAVCVGGRYVVSDIDTGEFFTGEKLYINPHAPGGLMARRRFPRLAAALIRMTRCMRRK
jgi:hypothetical protein